jgi:hypothetical protein
MNPGAVARRWRETLEIVDKFLECDPQIVQPGYRGTMDRVSRGLRGQPRSRSAPVSWKFVFEPVVRQ